MRQIIDKAAKVTMNTLDGKIQTRCCYRCMLRVSRPHVFVVACIGRRSGRSRYHAHARTHTHTHTHTQTDRQTDIRRAAHPLGSNPMMYVYACMDAGVARGVSSDRSDLARHTQLLRQRCGEIYGVLQVIETPSHHRIQHIHTTQHDPPVSE